MGLEAARDRGAQYYILMAKYIILLTNFPKTRGLILAQLRTAHQARHKQPQPMKFPQSTGAVSEWCPMP